MSDQAYSIGPIMKAARKFKKFNQADVAKAIGCSQSALSKMEHNLLVPSAPQWFLFSRFTSIPPESLETGVIDRNTKIRFNDEEVSLGFKLPKKYRAHRSQKVREIYPLLKFLEGKSPALHKEFIQSTGLDTEFFLDFDNLINFPFYLDTIQFLIKNGYGSDSMIKEIVTTWQNKIFWDHYGIEWAKIKNPKDLLQEFANEQIFFQADFQIKVESTADQTFLVYYLPEFHLQGLPLPAEEVIQFLNTYRKFTLENLIFREQGVHLKAEFSTEGAKSPLAARFILRAN